MKAKCKKCKGKVSTSDKVCPHCGVKNPSVDYIQGTIGLLIIIGAIYFFSGGNKDQGNTVATEQTKQVVKADTKKWYDGGAQILEKNGLAWQQSSLKEKVSGCAEIIARIVDKEMISEDIRYRINDEASWKKYSEECVSELDIAFKAEADPKANENLYANQKVLDTAVILLTMKGWIK